MELILTKRNLNLNELRGFILSPGNIYWQQKSGAYILLSAKSDFLNFQLIEKLSNANHTLLIEDQIDLMTQTSFVENFNRHKNEILVREKLEWRSKLLALFSKELGGEEVSQFELNQLGWKVFSKVDLDQARELMEEDIDFFQRSMSVSVSFTLCAFILGYYNDDFLSKLFTETFLSLMDLKTLGSTKNFKVQLEKMRFIESLQPEDNQVFADIFQLSTKRNVLLGERYDGSGFWKINKFEMTDLELVLVALNRHYSYVDGSHRSIFYEIKNSSFECDERVLNILRKCIVPTEGMISFEVSA